MSTVVRAIRGATTLDRDDPDHLSERVQELVKAMLKENALDSDDLVSLIFTATADISSKFPASAARELGLHDVPLLGAQELTVEGMMPLCIRVMAHVNTTQTRTDVKHIFMHGATTLRSDLTK